MRYGKEVVFPLIIGLTAAVLAGMAAYTYSFDQGAGDFGWALRAARDLLDGRNPYDRPFGILAIPYPLPAAFIGIPLTPLPDRLAGAFFFGASTGLLVSGLFLKGESWRLLMLAGPSYVYAIWTVQWSPLVTAMALLPALAPLGLAKPHIAIPVLAAKKMDYKVIVAGISLLYISLMLIPNWPLTWLKQIRPFGGENFLLLVMPAGALVLMGWKGGWMLLLYTLMPQRPFYDLLALWLLPSNRKQMMILTITAWLSFAAIMYADQWHVWRTWIALGYYYPLMLMGLYNICTQQSSEV
jgi:hypothetical protein